MNEIGVKTPLGVTKSYVYLNFGLALIVLYHYYLGCLPLYLNSVW